MNSDEFALSASPTNPSASNSAGRRIRVRSLKRSLTGQEASLPSIPSDDNDWVSPFTLPPLPALRKNRTQLDRSPEDRQHDRSGSSAYYAAAWGSPYATPSPNQSPASRFTRNKSLDLHSSPLVSRSASRYATQGSVPARDPVSIDKTRSASLSPIDSQAKSQRRNWLSESEDSASDNDQRSRKTPRQRRHITEESGLSRVRSHIVKESVDTITPETFNGASGMTNHSESPSNINTMAESHSALPPAASDETSIKEKPLPNLPASSSAMPQTSSLQSRPLLSVPTQSFQRPKKKVPWKGKSCIIAMPLTDREQAGLLPVMTRQEIQDRIQMWIDQGYPVHGFNVGNWYSPSDHVGGASRPTYPDFADIEFERKNNGPSVRIPNQKEWEDFVEYLKEEKLRALGVTPSNSEPPPSTMSPFSSTISRVSSTYPSVSASPPIPPPSVGSSHPRMGHSPFSPSMSIPANNYFSASNRGTPGLPNGSRPMHGYTQSIAIPGMGQRINSPFEYPISQPYGSGMRSPIEQIGGRRSFTPGHIQNMQSMGHILSPVNLPQQDFARSFSPSNPQIEQIRRQQEALARHQQHVQAQIVRAQHQRQMSMFPMRTMSTEQLPITPKLASPEREPPEIMHPTPRSHRHNLSAALEKGVTDSVVASSKDLSQALNGDRSDAKAAKHSKQELEDGEIVEEEEEDGTEELPILHRPETIKDVDEKTEVETNPSIAGTPLLLDDKNPFSSFKPLAPPAEATKRPGFGHAAQPSLSRLNVQAKEFNPSKPAFAPNPFNFDGNAFGDRVKAPEKPVSHAAKFSHKHNPSSLGLNVAAPIFTPVFAPLPAQPDESINESTSFAANASTNPTSTRSSIDANPKSSVFNFSTAENAEFSTPAKSSFNPASSAFNFTGGSRRDDTPQKSEAELQSSAFSFRSANFNVEAPEFKPLGLSISSVDFTPEKPKDFTNGTIFSDVVVDPSNKPNRRTKALPIIKPESRETTPAPAEKEEFDAEDRLMAPSDRNKRARHIGGDDEKILFADSAPFASLDDNSEKTDETEKVVDETEGVEQPVVAEPQQELAPTTTKLDTVIEERNATPSPDAAQNEVELAQVADSKDEAIVDATQAEGLTRDGPMPSAFVEAVPEISSREEVAKSDVIEQVTDEFKPADSEPADQANTATERSEETVSEKREDVELPEVVEDTFEASNDPQPTESVVESSNPAAASAPVPPLSAEAPAFTPVQSVIADSKPTLSPFAQPFEFRPAVKDFTPVLKPQTPELTSRDHVIKPKKGGLLASRFASSPPPAPAAPIAEKILERQPSPTVEGVIMSAEATEQPEKVTSDIAVVSPALREEESITEAPDSNANPTDTASLLARFREEDSRTGSVMSRPGDLSYEEINAVMKQFEDDPDLGVIREDTPVKSTPLIDMRYPQNFRSDAPSPSPRRLDRPFNRNQQRPYGGLGFDISGVHQLNFGTPEIDDWNAELSPGQQDKLEARAHFFDDHVNDLVDNVLESRLAPLERTLQSIQHSVQQVVSKPRSSRRSMSTENKESDADDEDDYDAYEGYSHYRSRSPHKRDRRSDKIKSAVIEAMALAQSNTQPAQIDTTAVETAIQELRDLTQKSMEQPRQPAVDLTDIQRLLAELRAHSQREAPAPVIDTYEFSKYIEEMKTLNQQRGSERQANFLAMQTTLNELRNLASEKPAPPVVDLSSIHSALAELQQQAEKQPVVPEVDLSTVHQALADLRQQALEKPAPPVVDLSAIQQELAELRKQAAEKPAAPEIDLSAIHSSLAELKQQSEGRPREASSDDMRSMLEDIISSHPRLAPQEVEQDSEPIKNLQTEVDGLNTLLRSAERRADGEAALRREAEEEQETLQRQLKDAQDQIASLKSASETAKKNLQDATQEKEDTRGLNNEIKDLRLKTEALEKTLDEYRSYKEELLTGLNKERRRTDGLERQLQSARHQHKEYAESRDSLREQLGQLQQRMSKVMEDVHHDEAEWRKREHDLASKNQLLQAALDHETNRRARVELESERLNKEHREHLQFKSKHEIAQEEMSRLAGIIVSLQAENKTHQDSAFSAQRELKFFQERTEDTITSKASRLQDELEASRAMYQTLQSDSDARIARLEGHLANAAVDLEAQKTKHDQNMEKLFENHNRAVREVEQRHAADLEQRLAFHEEKLIAFRAQHTHEINQAKQDKKHMEERYREKLEMSNDKIGHLESKVNDLQESLAVTKSAARAAVEAATMKGVNLPTPASSVMASPPHRASISSASMPIARGSDLPEKISPQALRETIMVLQDQLQNREQKIDKLEAELAAIDKEAPAQVKERDTEIVMLRELLDVRVDDLQELIGTLEKPGYDQTAVKDAAIRLKTQIKMEQQLKERMITGANLASNLPASIGSGLVNLTQSPRAMVAAAAWGNWRKVRDSGIGAVSDFANNLGAQTPSRVSSAPSTALNNLMSPPDAKVKPSSRSQLPATRPLAAAAASRIAGPSSPSSGARPLRAFNSQPRTLSGARPLARRGTNESQRPGSSGSIIRASEPSSTKVEPPSTPIQMKAESDFGDDVDDDASPLDGKTPDMDSDLEELVRSEKNAMKARSPRSRRTSRSSMNSSRKEVVEVIEESSS